MNLIEKIKSYESIINNKLKDNNVLVQIVQSGEKTGSIIIFKENYADKIFDIEMITSCQIRITENNKTIEYGLFIGNLGAWIFNLYNSLEYLYSFYGGKQNGKVFKLEDVRKISNKNTKNLQKERANGLTVHRAEIDEQPIVEGYLGPMFEKIDYGKIYLRYETPEIYNMLSS